MILAGYITLMGRRNAYKIFVGVPEEKRPLGEPRCSVRIILK
jgi:hypothetical protein